MYFIYKSLVTSGEVSIGQSVATTDDVSFNSVTANIQTTSLQLSGTQVSATAAEINLLDGVSYSGINSKSPLGLYTGVYTATVSGATGTAIPYTGILSNGETPSSNSMIIFFLNTSGIFVRDCIITDIDLDGAEDQFNVNWGSSYSGTIVLSYFIAL